MSETLCTLRGTGGGGGAKLVETVLWTNSAPTSQFGAQEITLSDSIDNYDYIAIRYACNNSNQTGASVSDDISLVSNVKNWGYNTSTYHNLGNLGSEISNNNIYCRSVFYISTTSLRFANAYQVGTATSANAACIPLAVIGIKNMGGVRTDEKYDILPFKSLPGNTAISFTTKGEAKAIWITCKAQSSGTDSMILTNVNPNTGEIDNNTIYRTRTASLNTFDINTGRSFTVTNGTISSSNLSSSAYYISCAYTY